MEQKTESRLTAGQKRVLRLALDAVMLVLLVLMYRKQVVSIAFHEIGGLALFGLVLIHLIGNARWIGAATRRFFSKDMPGFVRARYIVDALLLAALLAVGVTGILISEVVFHIRAAGGYQSLHYFSAALSIVLLGVHLGLHADYIFVKLLRNGATTAAKIALAAALAVVVAFGAYSIASSTFVGFLAAPAQASRFSHGTFVPSGDIALDGSSERPGDLSQLPEFSGETDAQQPQDGTGGAQPPQNGGNGGFGGGQGRGQGEGQGFGEGRRGGSGGAALLIAQYVSIVAFFAAATYGILKLAGKRKKPAANSELGEVIYVEQNDEPSSGEPSA